MAYPSDRSTPLSGYKDLINNSLVRYDCCSLMSVLSDSPVAMDRSVLNRIQQPFSLKLLKFSAQGRTVSALKYEMGQ